MLERWKTFVDRVGDRKIILSIVALSFILQLVFLRAPVIFGEPYLIAKNIVAGKGYVFTYPLTGREAVTCYATPVYTYLQAALLDAGLGERGIQIFNLLVLQFACFVIYRLIRRFAATEFALPAYFALAFYPPLWVLGYAMEPNTLNVLLVALTLELLLILTTDSSLKRWLQLGGLVGFQLLLRPDILLGSTLFACWLLYVRKDSLRTTVRGLVIAGGLALVIVAPWTVRNYSVFHKFVLVSSNAGFNLYVGNNPASTGEFSDVPLSNPASDRLHEAFLQYSQNHDQVEIDEFRFAQAREWIKEHPIEALKLDARKFMYHWFGRNDLGTQYHYAQGTFTMAYKLLSALLILLAAYALYQLRDRNLRLLFVTLALYSSLVSVIFFVQSRHRTLKIDPFMVPLASIGLLDIVARRHASVRQFAVQSIEM